MDMRAILAPAAVLVLWSCIVLFWLAYQRISAVRAIGANLPPTQRGVRGGDVDQHMPDAARWASHNYTHLFEQPTAFYAIVAVIALAGPVSSVTAGLAWAYVGLRILHSLWQLFVNQVPVRFLLFLLSSLCLLALAVIAVRSTLFI